MRRLGILATLPLAFLFFLVSAPSSQAATAIDLGTADSFAVVGASGVTNSGPSVVNGNLGTAPNPSVTGFGGAPNGTVNGAIHQADAVAAQAQAATTTAYNNAAGQGPTTMLATDRWLLLPALKSLGYSANTTDEAELEEARDLLLETKDTLLAYDDTTFYSKLVSGEAYLVEAWDGWCNYGIAEDDRIEFVVPEEGSDLWADTMVVLESSENKEAAFEFINYVLEAENGKDVVELLTYNTPNQAGMEQLDPKLVEQFPLLGRTPQELLEGEALTDLGEAQPTWSRIVSEVTG